MDASRPRIRLCRCARQTGWNGAVGASRYARLSRNVVALGSNARPLSLKNERPQMGPVCFWRWSESAADNAPGNGGMPTTSEFPILCRTWGYIDGKCVYPFGAHRRFNLRRCLN
jgi:hypothetical protein